MLTVPQAREGVDDILMGSKERGLACPVCGRSLYGCPGHFGSQDLVIPVTIPTMIEENVNVSRCQCAVCYCTHLTPEHEEELLLLEPRKRLERAAKLCKTVRYCGELRDRATRRDEEKRKKKAPRPYHNRKLFELHMETQNQEEAAAMDTSVDSKRTPPVTLSSASSSTSSSTSSVAASSSAGPPASKDVARHAGTRHRRSRHASKSTRRMPSASDRVAVFDSVPVDGATSATLGDKSSGTGDAAGSSGDDVEGDARDDEGRAIRDEDDSSSSESDSEQEKIPGVAFEEDDEVNEPEVDGGLGAGDTGVPDDNDDVGGDGGEDEEKSAEDEDDDDNDDADDGDDGATDDSADESGRRRRKKSRPAKRATRGGRGGRGGKGRGVLTTAALAGARGGRKVRGGAGAGAHVAAGRARGRGRGGGVGTGATLSRAGSQPRAAKRRRGETAPADAAAAAATTSVKPEFTLSTLSDDVAAQWKEYNEDVDQLWRESSHDRFSHLERPYDAARCQSGLGCGAPVPEYTNVGLNIHATYDQAWLGSASKRNWPEHNHWRLYQARRYMRPRDHIVLGLHHEISPARGLMYLSLLVLPPGDRPTKNEGSKNADSDESTGFLRMITHHRNRLMLKLWEEGIAQIYHTPGVRNGMMFYLDPNRLPSSHRHVFWVKRPRPDMNRCSCEPGRGKRCTCDLSGERVPCRCTHPTVCVCILDSLPAESPLLLQGKRLLAREDAMAAVQCASANVRVCRLARQHVDSVPATRFIGDQAAPAQARSLRDRVFALDENCRDAEQNALESLKAIEDDAPTLEEVEALANEARQAALWAEESTSNLTLLVRQLVPTATGVRSPDAGGGDATSVGAGVPLTVCTSPPAGSTPTGPWSASPAHSGVTDAAAAAGSPVGAVAGPSSVLSARPEPLIRLRAVSMAGKIEKAGKRRPKGWVDMHTEVGNDLVLLISGAIKDDAKRPMRGRASNTAKAGGGVGGAAAGGLGGGGGGSAAAAAGKKVGSSTWQHTSAAANKVALLQKSLAGKQIGKKGRMRGQLGGKQSRFTTRNVIVPVVVGIDTDEIGLPITVKKTLSFPEMLEDWNRAALFDRLRQREVNQLRRADSTEIMHNLSYMNCNTLVPEEHTVFECQLQNGAAFIEGRQPTLAKTSLQGKRAKFVPTWAKMLPVENCAPYGADFDGDEMLSLEARSNMSTSEIIQLMMSSKQFSSQHGSACTMGMVQNASFVAFLLTRRDCLLTREEMMQLVGQFVLPTSLRGLTTTSARRIRAMFLRHLYAKDGDGLPPPAIASPVERWTGCQLVSMFLPTGMFYGNSLPASLDVARSGDSVVIRGGHLLCGRLNKFNLGPGSNTLPHVISQQYGADVTKGWIHGNSVVWNAYLAWRPVSLQRSDYKMADEEFRKTVLHATTVTAGRDDWQTYDLRTPNDCEVSVRKMLSRARELITSKFERNLDERNHRLHRDAGPERSRQRIADEGSVQPNHVLAMIRSGTKGTMKQLGVLGAIRGQQEDEHGNRLTAIGSHSHRTIHLPQAHGFVSRSLTQGTHPIEMYHHLDVARRGMITTSTKIPKAGYLERCLASMSSGIQAHHDGTVRGSEGRIYQFRNGDDGLDPSRCERTDLRFYTPSDKASPVLAQAQCELMRWLADRVYREAGDAAIRKLVAPVQFQRLLARVRSQHRLRRSAAAGAADASDDVPLASAEQVDQMVTGWLRRLQTQYRLDLAQDNLLLYTLVLDFLSGWHVVDQCHLTGSEFTALLTELEARIRSGRTQAGESVGTTAAQSLVEPAIQGGLNQQKGSKQVAGDVASLNAISNEQQVNDSLRASKKEGSATMTVYLKPPYNLSSDTAAVCAQPLIGRRMLSLMSGWKSYEKGRPEQWPDQWARDLIAIQHPDFWRAPAKGVSASKEGSLYKFCTMRLEFRRDLCDALSLSAFQLQVYIKTAFKTRGIYTLSKGDHCPGHDLVMYVNIDIRKHQQLTKRIETFRKKSPELRINYVTITEAALIRCLFTVLVSGIPQVTAAYPVELSRYRYDPTKPASPLVRTEEWGLKTHGSNLDLLIRYPFVHYESCSTTFVHDVNKHFGIESARVCQEESLDTLVRAVSAVDVRHVKLLADIMTAYSKGHILPMTRDGMAESDSNSPLKLAAFEEILTNLRKGAVHYRTDELLSVVAASIVGNQIPSGTDTVDIITAPDSARPRAAVSSSATTATLPTHPGSGDRPAGTLEPVPATAPAPRTSRRPHRLLAALKAGDEPSRPSAPPSMEAYCTNRRPRLAPCKMYDWAFYRQFCSSDPTDAPAAPTTGPAASKDSRGRPGMTLTRALLDRYALSRRSGYTNEGSQRWTGPRQDPASDLLLPSVVVDTGAPATTPTLFDHRHTARSCFFPEHAPPSPFAPTVNDSSTPAPGVDCAMPEATPAWASLRSSLLIGETGTRFIETAPPMARSVSMLHTGLIQFAASDSSAPLGLPHPQGYRTIALWNP